MATAKKSTARKKPAAKKAAPKRASAKPVLKTKVTKVRRAPATSGQVRSFRPAKPEQPFLTVQPSIQTLYWLVLAVFVVGLGVWVAGINVKVQSLYDQIDSQNAEASSLVIPVKK